MLTTARDIVLRLGDISEARIREELSGNICRCTGYVGIVEAVKRVAAGKAPNAMAAAVPVLSRKFDDRRPTSDAKSRHVAKPVSPAIAGTDQPSAGQIEGGVSIEERIRVGATPAEVWSVLSDLRRVVPCVPGAEITTLEGENLTGKVKMALGPIKASLQRTGNRRHG